jgi:hypothetical protein
MAATRLSLGHRSPSETSFKSIACPTPPSTGVTLREKLVSQVSIGYGSPFVILAPCLFARVLVGGQGGSRGADKRSIDVATGRGQVITPQLTYLQFCKSLFVLGDRCIDSSAIDFRRGGHHGINH